MAVEGCSADADDFGDGFHGVLTAGVHLLGDGEFVGRQGRWSAADASSGSCGGEAGHGAVADEVAFELGQGAARAEHRNGKSRLGVRWREHLFFVLETIVCGRVGRCACFAWSVV